MQQCVICGTNSESWITRKILNEQLSKAWKLDEEQISKINLRESSYCPACGNSARTRALGNAIIKKVIFKNVTLFKDWIKEANNKELKVAEINSCGKLHDFLSGLKHLSYSEYHALPGNSINNIANEDITRLSYRSNSFGLVVHSETLEYVPDYKKALSECVRILKPGGICIYTVPVINNRLTVKCIEIDEKGNLRYLQPPSYHGCSDDYLVFWEFGDDFPELSNSELVYSEPGLFNYVFAVRKDSKWNIIVSRLKNMLSF